MHCLFTMTWWLSEATLVSCLSQALCNVRTVPWDESKAGAARAGEQSIPTEAQKHKGSNVCASQEEQESHRWAFLYSDRVVTSSPTSDCETFEERRRSSLIPTTSSTKHETPGGLLTNSLIIENHNFPKVPLQFKSDCMVWRNLSSSQLWKWITDRLEKGQARVWVFLA